MAMTGLAIAAALALAKDQLVDKPADKRKRHLAAETERNSPWTGMHAQPLNDSNTIGTVMQGAATGTQIGQGYANNQADNAYKSALTKRVSDGYSPGTSAWGGGNFDPYMDQKTKENIPF